MQFTYVPIPDRAHYDLHIGKSWFCIHCQGVIPNSYTDIHKSFHENYTNRKDGNMSTVLWCDPGDHAFKAGVPGALHTEGSQTNDDGITETVTIDACPLHNPFRTDPKNIAKELNARYPVDPTE